MQASRLVSQVKISLNMDTLFFVISKLLHFLIEPLNWVLIFVILALLFLSLRKSHLCKRFLVLALIDLTLVGWLPASEVFLRALEDVVPKIEVSKLTANDVGGIIILGGAIRSGKLGLERGEVSLGESAERVTKAFELMRKYPDLPFIFSGYSDRLALKGVSEADGFKQLVKEQGFEDHLGFYENQSRNTYENVIYIKPIILQESQGLSAKPWLLITSARHMYRSTLIFRNQGLEVIPVPVDYLTAFDLSWGSFDLEVGAQYWNKLIHEIVGLFAYWITGKI